MTALSDLPIACEDIPPDAATVLNTKTPDLEQPSVNIESVVEAIRVLGLQRILFMLTALILEEVCGVAYTIKYYYLHHCAAADAFDIAWKRTSAGAHMHGSSAADQTIDVAASVHPSDALVDAASSGRYS
jgi:hypothetical protein